MRKNSFKMYENLALVSQIGITMAVYIVGAVMLGNFIDTRLGSSPVALLICLLVGIVAAFYNVFNMLLAIGTKHEDDDPWKK